MGDGYNFPQLKAAILPLSYAYFPVTRRLAIDINGKVTVYDTQNYQISELSQQQPGSGASSAALM